MVRVTTLGMLAVDGVPVRGRRLATAVRALLDARGRPVPTTSLIDAIWDGDGPRDASAAVQALVSRVRRLGLPVVAVPDGYQLPLDDLSIDAIQAVALVAAARRALRDGDHGAAKRHAGAARTLLPAAPDVDDPAICSVLREVGTVRAEVALAAAEGVGPDGPGVEADLRRLVTAAPPDEPAAVLLVQLLAAQGRDAQALDLIEALRRDLKESFGADPSPAVARAHVALLRGELAPPTSTTAPAHEASAPAEPAVEPGAYPLPAGWRRATTALLGRDTDLAAVMAALAQAGLVTVVGTGGVGKTRLAAEIARGRAGAGEPVRVVELAGVRAEEVADTVATAIRGTTATRGPDGAGAWADDEANSVRRAARELVGLVVLDNCEHVLAAAAEAADAILAVALRATVLATSRAPLGLAGEMVHRLRALSDDDAVALLESRARSGGATLPWPRARVLELCQRLDNLPLALELAASRLRHMPIEDVLAGLTDRFQLLDDALRGLPERQASLWAMVHWSHELLPLAVRRQWWRLAVIPAPFTVDAAAAVAADDAPDGGTAVRTALATLVEQSLLTVDRGDDDTTRYRMLETVREYGQARLDAAGGRPAAMAGLVGWAARCASDRAGDLVGPTQAQTLAWCGEEADNLVAALRWAVGAGDEMSTVDIARTLFHLWLVRDRHREVVAWSGRLLHIDDPFARRASAIVKGAASGRPLPDADRLAWTLALASVVTRAAGLGPQRLTAVARRALRVLLVQRRQQLSPRASALAQLLTSVDATKVEGSLATAESLLAHADPLIRGFGLFLRSTVRASDGNDEATLADLVDTYHHFEAVDDPWLMGVAAQLVAAGLAAQGRSPQEWLRRGAGHLATVGATADVRNLQIELDLQLALDGDEQAEARLATAAREAAICEATTARLGLAALSLLRGRNADAVALTEEIARAAGQAGWPTPLSVVQVRASAALLRVLAANRPFDGEDAVGWAGEVDQADRFAVAQLRLCREPAASTGDIATVGACAVAGAELAAHRGEEELARQLWALGARLGARVGYPMQAVSRLARALGDPDRRVRLLVPLQALPLSAVTAQVRELMDRLLAPATATPSDDRRAVPAA